MTVTPVRAERVLLFDDVLVLLQVGMVLTRQSGGHRGHLGSG